MFCKFEYFDIDKRQQRQREHDRPMPYAERNKPEQARHGRNGSYEHHNDRAEQCRAYHEFIYAAPFSEHGKMRAAVIDVYDGRKSHYEKGHRLRNGETRLYAAAEIKMLTCKDGNKRGYGKHDGDLYDFGNKPAGVN